MPTVMRIGTYRFFFYAADRDEPMHIHVERDDNTAKYWLDPVRLQSSGGFSSSELNKVQAMVQENQARLAREWDGFFNG